MRRTFPITRIPRTTPSLFQGRLPIASRTTVRSPSNRVRRHDLSDMGEAFKTAPPIGFALPGPPGGKMLVGRHAPRGSLHKRRPPRPAPTRSGEAVGIAVVLSDAPG